MNDGFFEEETVRQQAEAKWESSPDIRAEFGNKERYVAFKLAQAQGLVKIQGYSMPSDD